MKVLVNQTGWELLPDSQSGEARPQDDPEGGAASAGASKPGSGVFAKTVQPDTSPDSFSPTEPAPPPGEEESAQAAPLSLPRPPALPQFATGLPVTDPSGGSEPPEVA